MSATAFQPEPSAKAPCTRTTFLICCFTTILLCGKDPLGSVDLQCRTLSHQSEPLRPGRRTCFSHDRKGLLATGYMCGGGSLFDELGCFLRVRHVSHMAGIHFDR